MTAETNGLQQLIDAHSAYEQTVSESYDEVLYEVSARAAAAGSLGKADIGSLVFWKRLRADTRWARALHGVHDSTVREATGAMYTLANDENVDVASAAGAARATLSSLPGFRRGDALASALILAAAPTRMAIFDRRAFRALHTLGIEVSSKPGQFKRYMQIVEDIRGQLGSQRVDWCARDVDKALFQLGG